MSSPDSFRGIGVLAVGGQPAAPQLLASPAEQRFCCAAHPSAASSLPSRADPTMTTVSLGALSVAEALDPDFGLRPDGDLADCRTWFAGASRVRDAEAVHRAALTDVRAAGYGGLRTIDNATEGGLRP